MKLIESRGSEDKHYREEMECLLQEDANQKSRVLKQETQREHRNLREKAIKKAREDFKEVKSELDERAKSEEDSLLEVNIDRFLMTMLILLLIFITLMYFLGKG